MPAGWGSVVQSRRFSEGPPLPNTDGRQANASRIECITPSMFVRTSEFGNLSTTNPARVRIASRTASCSHCRGSLWWPPSSSTTNRRSRQTKSRKYPCHGPLPAELIALGAEAFEATPEPDLWLRHVVAEFAGSLGRRRDHSRFPHPIRASADHPPLKGRDYDHAVFSFRWRPWRSRWRSSSSAR